MSDEKSATTRRIPSTTRIGGGPSDHEQRPVTEPDRLGRSMRELLDLLHSTEPIESHLGIRVKASDASVAVSTAHRKGGNPEASISTKSAAASATWEIGLGD